MNEWMMDGVGRVGGGEVEEYIILNLALWAEVQVLGQFFSNIVWF